MSKKKWITVLAVIIVIILILYRVYTSFFQKPEEVQDVTTVTYEVAKIMDIDSSSPVSAKILPREEVAVMPTAQGLITNVYAEIGDHVSEGSVLFTLENTQQTSIVNKAKEGLSLAKSSFDRMERLYNEGAISKQEYENIRAKLIAAREDYRSASDALSNCIVKSPIDGYITSVNISNGSMAGGSMPAMTVADVSSLVIKVSVSQSLVSKINQGDEVDVKISALGGKVYKGIVDAVSPAPTVNSMSYPIKINVKDEKGEVKAGMFGEILIKTDEKNKVLAVPVNSIMVKKGEVSVAVLQKGNIVKFKNVETGAENREYVEIKKGIEAGEKVINSGQEYVDDGEKVLIKKSNQSEKNDSSKESE